MTAGPSLSAEERRLWGAVMATVRPLRAAAVSHPPAAPGRVEPGKGRSPPPAARERQHERPARPAARAVATPVATRAPPDTLDGGWDRRLSRGTVAPDASLDLHGHTLASAHALLDQGLGRSIARGDRVLLLVTGKPPRSGSERPHARGAIRAAVADWLVASRHADRIAAVRGAHPRHGGAGALYIVLRRPRTPA